MANREGGYVIQTHEVRSVLRIDCVGIDPASTAQAQRPFRRGFDACNRSDADCKVAISAFVGEGGFAGQRAIDLSRRLAWAVRGGKLDARAIACFVEVIYDSRFSASTVNKIIENVGSAGNRVLRGIPDRAGA